MIKSLPNLYSHLRLKQNELAAITGNISKLYSAIDRPKMKFGEEQRDCAGTVKYRHLLRPEQKLKDLQKRIHALLSNIELPYYMHGSVKNKNNIQNALNHIYSRYFLTIDLNSFFTNINHHKIFKTYSSNHFSPTIARLLTQLTTFKGSLPQGAPTSPVLANLTFLPTGNKLLELAQKYDIVFTTYLDDISFSSKKCFKRLVPDILETLKADGFFPHNQKIHYRERDIEITGLFIRNRRLYVTEIMQEKARKNKYIRAYINQVRLANKWLGILEKRNPDQKNYRQ